MTNINKKKEKKIEEWKKILREEGLPEWKIKIIKSGGGLCVYKPHKEIWVDYRHSTGMFLHELTHALYGKGHDAIWADKFTMLIEKHDHHN